jgi:hypothetical protein
MNFSFRQLAELNFPHIFQTGAELYYHPFFLHYTIIVPFLSSTPSDRLIKARSILTELNTILTIYNPISSW